MRGDRIGLIGPNGAGKTTLLQLILGTARRPTRAACASARSLQVAYFDQMREQLDPERSASPTRSARAPSGWRRQRAVTHVASYLKDFLFPPQRAARR
mgnify:CR=1 FL=1